ncbi:MAG: hypothetical protein ACOVN5_05460 [Aquidulcibacter sp.]
MVEQDKITTLDYEIDAATHLMIEAEGNGWTNHIEKVSKLLQQRVELTRPEVFSEIRELLRKRL